MNSKVIVFLIVILMLFNINIVSALSNSGGGDWKYYKEITIIENSGMTLDDYQVSIELNPSNFPETTKNDGSDIRFMQEGKELSLWIENYDTVKKTAKIWVKVASIPANGEAKIKMYYGNEKAGYVSDVDTTLEFFDDFKDGTFTDKWYVLSGDWIESNGIIKQTKEYTSEVLFAKDVALTDNILVESKCRGSFEVGVGARMSDSSYHWTYTAKPHEKWIQVITPDERNWSSVFEMSEKNWYIVRGTIIGKNTKAEIFDLQGKLLNSATASGHYTDVDNKVGLVSTFPAEWDWVRVRRYTSPEPIYYISAEYPVEIIPSLKLTKSVSSSTIQEGEPTVITILVENTGNGEANNIEIKDTIPDSFEIINGSNQVNIDQIKPGKNRTIKYSFKASGLGKVISEPATLTYKNIDGNSYSTESNSINLMVLIATDTSSFNNISEFWMDDFLTDTLDTYSWDKVYNPRSIPGGFEYEKYRRDARDYSYKKEISNGELIVIGEDWFTGRIYAYKTIQFKKPIEKLQLEIKGTSNQGYYGNQSCIGVVIYESESDFLKNFDIDPEIGICGDTYINSTIALVGREELLVTETFLKEPRKDIILVLIASDPWAWTNGIESRTINKFDYIKLKGTYSSEVPEKKSPGFEVVLAIIGLFSVAYILRKQDVI